MHGIRATYNRMFCFVHVLRMEMELLNDVDNLADVDLKMYCERMLPICYELAV